MWSKFFNMRKKIRENLNRKEFDEQKVGQKLIILLKLSKQISLIHEIKINWAEFSIPWATFMA